jgi:hypothetical protein
LADLAIPSVPKAVLRIRAAQTVHNVQIHPGEVDNPTHLR